MKIPAAYLKIFLSCYGLVLVLGAKEDRDVLNTCLDGIKHKSKPGPEDALHQQCTPWKDRSCCTGNTTLDVHYKKSYNFNYDHCPGKKMSDKCREHFVQDLCFYECSPNVGPWLVETKQKIRRERFVDVPLCAIDCENWFNDCKDDWTCTNNWGRNFEWKDIDNDGKKENVCPSNAECHTFKNVFQSAKFFCENIWDHSWKVAPAGQPCMHIWFDNKDGVNPNDAVAKWAVEHGEVSGLIKVSESGGERSFGSMSVAVFAVTIAAALW